MRKSIFILITLCVSGCDTQHSKTITNDTTTAAHSTPAMPDAYDKLLAQFTEITFDTLAIATPESGENEAAFTGTELDSAMIALLPEEVSRRDKSFAVSAFALDKEHIALILRVPGEYDVNNIALLMFNKVSRKLSYKSDLAFTWGDAGYAVEQTSWLIHNKEKELNQLVDLYTWSETDTDDPADAVATTTNNYSLIHIGPYKADTLSKDSTVLLQTYGHLLRKPAHLL